MPSKEQSHKNDKVTARRRSPRRENKSATLFGPQKPLTMIAQQARLNPDSLSPDEVIQLQRTIGNGALGQLRAGAVQPQAGEKALAERPGITSGDHGQAKDDPGTMKPAFQLKMSPFVIQRVIKEKPNKLYHNSAELPPAAQVNPTLVGLVNAPDTALVNSRDDLIKRGQGQPAPILTPYRHLIGERHDASRFEEAVRDWEWGAKKMEEGLQTSASVKDPTTEALISPPWYFLAGSPQAGALPLENLHARTLADIATYRFAVRNLAEVADIVSVEVSQGNLSHKPAYEKLREEAEAQKQELRLRLEAYEQACIQLLKQNPQQNNPGQGLGALALDMRDKWQRLKEQMDLVSSSPWNLVLSDAGDRDVVRKLEGRRDQGQDLVSKLSTLAAHLVNLAKAETVQPAQQLAVEGAWNATAADKSGLNETATIREIFMAQNINALPKPAIVRIGRAHVSNLAGQITDGKYHQSYDDFQADIQGP